MADSTPALDRTYVSEAMRTMRASWWTLLKARLFGRKYIGRDSGCTVTLYEYKGVMYLLSCKQDETDVPF